MRIVWFVGCGLEIIVELLSLGFSERYHIILVEGDVEHVENDLEEDISMDETASDDEEVLSSTYNKLLRESFLMMGPCEEMVQLRRYKGQSSVLEDHATAPPPPRSDTINAKGHGIISRLLTLLPTINVCL